MPPKKLYYSPSSFIRDRQRYTTNMKYCKNDKEINELHSLCFLNSASKLRRSRGASLHRIDAKKVQVQRMVGEICAKRWGKQKRGILHCQLVDTWELWHNWSNRRAAFEALLNQVLAFAIGDHGLHFRCCVSVHMSSLACDQQQNLRAGQSGQLECFLHNTRLSLGKCNMAAGLVLNIIDFDFATAVA